VIHYIQRSTSPELCHLPAGFRLAIRRSLVLLSLLLAACGSPAVKNDSTEAMAVDALSPEQISEMLNKANDLQGSKRTAIILDAADAMFRAEELDWARNTLASLYTEALSDEQYFTYATLSAQVSLAEGEHFLAKRFLWEQRFQSLLTSLPLGNKLYAREMRAILLCDIAEYRNCISERLLIDAVYEQARTSMVDERELNQDLLWLALMELPLKDLQLEAQMQSDSTAKGWYTLASMSKDNQHSMRMQMESVDEWALRWPEHPASLRLPADLQLLQQLLDEQARQIAILLPLSGKLAKAAEAIRDGMMAAYYRMEENGDRLPELRFYDSSSNADSVYDKAVADGAELVLGPLDKDQIDELALRPALPVPTLALNYVDDPIGDTALLFQFGLALEDEARQVAERAWRDGHRRAMVLAPDNTWGDRSANTFINTWEYLGGSLIGDYRFKGQKDYSTLIRDAMDVSASQQRARRMRQILGQQVEFEPRPRKDIDLIFLMAHPAQARQIKPTLAFHYAGAIPVYSTSHIFNGVVDSNADRDMNGIRFATLPWFFDDNLPEKQAISHGSSSLSSYQRLYALGVDAFHIYPRLRQLEQVRNAHFYGSTGTITVDEQRRIVREQTWAQFIRGRAYPMPTVSLQDAL